MNAVGQQEGSTLTASQQDWLRVRRYLTDHRYVLAQSAAGEYPEAYQVTGTPLLAADTWLPSEPLPLDRIDLELESGADFAGLSGSEPLSASVRPFRADGTRYSSYASAMADLAAPAVFEDRSTYRLRAADLSRGRGHMRFGRGTYFDSINVGEAAAHEYADAQLDTRQGEPLRSAIGLPVDPTRRPINVAISTLTIRRDPSTGKASFLLHWRDPTKVGHAGGLYQVLPVGIFQASDDQPWNQRNDFSLWRCMIREYAEELLGESEDRGSDHEPIDYDAWPFVARITRAREDGHVRPYCLGLGVDPLTFATDLLTVVVFDAAVFDELFGDLVSHNAEGRLLTSRTGESVGFAFTGDEIDRLTQHEPVQAAGAALLGLAWQHRRMLVG